MSLGPINTLTIKGKGKYVVVRNCGAIIIWVVQGVGVDQGPVNACTVPMPAECTMLPSASRTGVRNGR